MAVRRAPGLPDGAGVVAPATEEERTATRLFLTWVAQVVEIGETNADRAEQGRQGCEAF